MSADIQKEAIFDARIVQNRPRYAVQRGALSLTNAPFNAIAATSSQHTYNIYVPSENVFVDRKLELTTSMLLNFTVSVAAAASVAGAPIFSFGEDGSVCPFPMNSLVSTLSATINDTTTVINSQDVLKEVLRLCDYKKNRLQRTCPTMLDKYQCYDDAYGAVNNPLGGYESSSEPAEMGNGAFGGCQWSSPAGAPLLETTQLAGWNAAYPANTSTTNYQVINGVPCILPASAGAAGTYNLWLRLTTTEPLVLSPMVFADCHEWDTGLFGINNIQLVLNLQSSAARLIRTTSRNGRSIPSGGVPVLFGSQPFSPARVNVQFLTPSLEIPLPPKSVVPYMEFPRYISQPGTIVQPYQTASLQSQTITLPQIPDLLIIYVKPGAQVSGSALTVPLPSNVADFYLPIATLANSNIANPLSVNFDNFSGLLSSQTAEEIYAMCVKNGLDMDWGQWSGVVRSSGASHITVPAPTASDVGGLATTQRGQRIPSTGTILVLRPSQDITLQSGQAPSLVGNFTLQYNLQVYNNSNYAIQPTLYTITANSGFFESIRGSSRIIKGVLSEQDIISAPLAPEGTTGGLERMVGGSYHAMGNALSKARKFFAETVPSAVKSMGHKMGIGRGGDGAGAGGGTGAGLERRLR
jgi:hypothetical protein